MTRITWAGLVDDYYWNKPLSWSTRQVPTSTNVVIIAPTSAVAIDVSSEAVQALTIDGFVTLTDAPRATFIIGIKSANSTSSNGRPLFSTANLSPDS